MPVLFDSSIFIHFINAALHSALGAHAADWLIDLFQGAFGGVGDMFDLQ